MRSYAVLLSSMMALSALATGARAQQAPSRGEVVAQIPIGDELPTEKVEIVEHRQPVVVAQTPLPRPRPARTVAVRPQAARVAVVRPADDASRAAPLPVQRVALATKPKSPLFWMSVGAGF
jgi:hypothetical protein